MSHLNLKRGHKPTHARPSDGSYGVMTMNVGVPPASMVSGGVIRSRLALSVASLPLGTRLSLEVWIRETEGNTAAMPEGPPATAELT